tara:strand:- start:234 stop:410 length:177 start_codon:yes stop_codon:yes gene_type:complete
MKKKITVIEPKEAKISPEKFFVLKKCTKETNVINNITYTVGACLDITEKPRKIGIKNQ